MHFLKIVLPLPVNQIIHTLEAHGYEAYAVGGCVRDTLLGRTPQDWDITTSALPEQVKELFSHTIDTGIAHGTVTVMLDRVGYEVTTYRIDGEYEDARHPKEVTFTSNLIEDLKRRDFTINAMAYNEQMGLVDAFDGITHLKEKRIVCVGNAIDRFSEDALRMLRAVRFAAQLGFSIAEDTKEGIRQLAPTIRKVSAERIQTELNKLIISEHPDDLRQAYELGLTKIFLPEFDRMMETEQVNKHHMYSVGEHTLHAMLAIPADKVLRLTMLFHDIAKPVCRTMDEKGQHHFKGHPKVGAEMTRAILKRLKYDNATIDTVCKLILYHDDRPQLSPRVVRRSMNRMGTELMPMFFLVQRADSLGQSMYQREQKLAYILAYEQFYQQIVSLNQCVCKKDLMITGRDLIELGMKPGPMMGEVIDELLEKVLDHPEYNTKDTLLEMARERICLPVHK